MDNRYYDNLIEEIKPFFDEQKFTEQEDGSFKNDAWATKIQYDEDSQMYKLYLANLSQEDESDYSLVSSWLFDDSQNAKDAASVGMDFAETLREKLGVKVGRKTSAKIEMPTAATKDGNMTIEGFTKKLLDVYPVLKDSYKLHVATYGNFLYLAFYSSEAVPLVKATLTENNKKSVKKLYDIFENAYIQGDKETVNATVAILAAVAYKDEALKEAVNAFVSENSHFSASVLSFLAVLETNKKLAKTLIK